MSSNVKNVFNVILGLILLGLILWATLWIFVHFGNWFDRLSDNVKTAIFAAVPVIAVAILGYFANKSLEMKRSVEQALRPRKLELYEEFIVFLMSIFGKEEFVKKPSETEITQFFVDKTPELMTFASNKVIEKWGKLRVGLDAANDKDKMLLVEDMLKEIRVDLGHDRRGFHKGDILRLFINDIDGYLKK